MWMAGNSIGAGLSPACANSAEQAKVRPKIKVEIFMRHQAVGEMVGFSNLPIITIIEMDNKEDSMPTSSRDYDPANNDTYTRRFSLNPGLDAEVHQFRHERGTTTLTGVPGFFSAESSRIGKNSVLQFPEGERLRLVFIRTLKIATPMPITLVERYERKPDTMLWEQSTPVFFDPQHEKFVLLLDRRFLRDTSVADLGLSELKTHQVKHGYHFYEVVQPETGTTYGTFLGLHFDSLESIREAGSTVGHGTGNNPLFFIADLYVACRNRLETGRKILMIRTLAHNKNRGLIADLQGRITPSISSHHFGLEYTVAYQFSDRYYLADENEEVDKTRSFKLNKDKEQRAGPPNDWQHAEEKGDLVILDYDLGQHNLLRELSARLDTFHRDLNAVFKRSINQHEKVDQPLLALNQLLIEGT